MPTAAGRPTADEKRELDRIKSRDARRAITARIASGEWIAAEADRFAAALAAHRAGQAAGTIRQYESVRQSYPAGEEYIVNRIKIDEGQARSYGVSDELTRRGIDHHCMMGFGIAQGRSSIEYSVEAR